MLVRLILALISFNCAYVCAQAASSQADSAFVTYQVAAPSQSLSVAEQPFALGEALVRELRRGGYVIFIRHGTVLKETNDQRGRGEWWKNCSTTQKLAPTALAQAKAIGDAIRTQRIPVNEVASSEFCRAYDTGVFLGLTAPRREPALNDPELAPPLRPRLSLREVLSMPLAGGNLVLVGHMLPGINGDDSPPLIIPFGYTAVIKPERDGRFYPLVILSPGQWQTIGKLNIQELPPATPPVPQLPPPTPLIDPRIELKGVALINALRQGGYLMYMRHALSNLGSDQDLLKNKKWWEDCSIQRNISQEGREQAFKVGSAIRQLKLPIAEVKAAQFCRTRDTAYLLGLGPVEIEEGLNHIIGQRSGYDVNAARFQLLTTPPPKGQNIVMVSHTHGSPRPEERIMSGLAEAEIAIFRPDGKGGTSPVARIPLAEWDNLTKLSIGIPQ